MKYGLSYVTVIVVLLGNLPRVKAYEDLPTFCASVSPALLGGLEAPYKQQRAPDGTVYCEGLLPKPIAIPPVRVVSVKQAQSPDITFVEAGR
jgi:hypothetical protein